LSIVANFLKRYFASDVMLRRRAWAKHLGSLAERRGLYLYPHHLKWQVDERFLELVHEWGDVPGGTPDCCNLLYSCGRYVAKRRLGGATAECGVRFGKGSFFFLAGARDADPTWMAPHLLFDSFAGLPEPTEADEGTTRRDAWKAGQLAVPEEVVRRQLKRFDQQCVFRPGWIPQSFEGLGDQRFGFVHVDLDLHDSTRDAFQYFYPRMLRGGLMLCDDYGFSSCPGVTRAVDDFFADKPEPLLPLPSGPVLIVRL
jgi:hypothetical protein